MVVTCHQGKWDDTNGMHALQYVLHGNPSQAAAHCSGLPSVSIWGNGYYEFFFLLSKQVMLITYKQSSMVTELITLKRSLILTIAWVFAYSCAWTGVLLSTEKREISTNDMKDWKNFNFILDFVQENK
jgi:hypothetical protein